MLPWPSRPRRASLGHRHAPELAAVDVGDAVVPRQPLVDERVVGRQQVEHAAVLAHRRCSKKQLRLALQRLPQVVVEVGELVLAGHHVPQVAQMQPLPGEVADERRGARVGQHPPAPAARATAGSVEAPLPRRRQQLVVRHAAPQEERQARSQLQVADAVRRSQRRPSAGRVRPGTRTPDRTGCAAAPAGCRRRSRPSRGPSGRRPAAAQCRRRRPAADRRAAPAS